MPKLSLAELEQFDPSARPGANERRFLCPLCHGDRRRDAAHRSLCANVQTGAWKCQRCGEKGLLIEHQSEPEKGEKSKQGGRARRGIITRPTLRPVPVPATINPDQEKYNYAAELATLEPLQSSPAAAYLEGRSIPLHVAERSPVRYSPKFLGRAAVVFGFHDEYGRNVASQGRCIAPGDPWKRTIKQTDGAHGGIFIARGALEAERPIITEAPIDALTLAACGFPAIATGGTSYPDWLARAFALRTVILAHDADAAGDRAAQEIGDALRVTGASPKRLRPTGEKDWNAILCKFGLAYLREALLQALDPFAD